MGLPPKLAHKKAGYAESDGNYNQVLAVPVVQAAIEIELRRELHGKIAPLALATLYEILRNRDKKYSERIRLDAAKIALDRAGFVPPKQSTPGSEDKAPEAMSTAELQALVDKLTHELGDRAKPIEPAEDAQLADLL